MNVKKLFSTARIALLAVVLQFLSNVVAGADAPEAVPYIGADAPAPEISTKSVDPSGTMISLTEGNLIESQGADGTSDSTCSTCRGSQTASNDTHSLSLHVTYNSRDADGSRAQVDTVMGNGWTHSFNIFLFSQNGSNAMFRFDGGGRVTRYTRNPDNTFTADPGYFETLVQKTRSTFLLTQKDRTKFVFAVVPGTPFQFGGAVYRLTQIQDRNQDTVNLIYTGGYLTSVKDTYGREMTFLYDGHLPNQHIASVKDPLRRITTFTYDPTGTKLDSIIDPMGKTVRYTYNSNYQLTTKVDKDGRLFSYSYTNNKPTDSTDSLRAPNFSQSNPNNWATDPSALVADQLLVYLPSITTKTDGRGNLWQSEYDSHGYVTRMTAPDGATTQYTYDAGTRRVNSVTDANNHTTQYEYDSQGNRTKITLAAPFNYVTTFTYEPVFNMMTSTTDPKGRVTAFAYDGHGNRMMETDPLLQTRPWTYDNHGNVMTETDKRGNTTTYTYDPGGNCETMTAPPVEPPPAVGYITRMRYDRDDEPESEIDPNNNPSKFKYDGLGRLIQETDPALQSTRSFYDGQGNQIQATDRNDHSTLFEYDHRQRLIRTTDALGKTTTATYDGNNNRASMTDKNGHTTTFEYDVQNRLNRTTDAEGNVSTMNYDPAGNLTSTTDANLHTTTYTYDALNRRSTVTDAIGYVTVFEYDMGGSECGACGATPGSTLITKQTDGNGKVTYFKYDPLDRLTTIVRKEGDTADVIDASDAVTRYRYDPNNNRDRITEPNGNITEYLYDALNRRVSERNAAGDVTLFTYDGVNHLKTITAPSGNVTTNKYDTRDRLERVDDSVGPVVSYTYDNVGNRLSQADGNGNTTRYKYDFINRPTIVTDPLTRTTVTQYDPVGNVIKVSDRESHFTSNVYDSINRRVSSTDALGHTTRYQYDGVGNVLKITDANGHATQYQYDDINRGIRETYADPPPNTRTFAYDAVKLTSRTDQKNQTTVYHYNDLYFLKMRTYPFGPADTFDYDLSGRMSRAERGGWVVTFVYDGANRVTQTTQNGKTLGYVYNIPGRTCVVTYPGGRTITERMDFRSRLFTIDDGVSPPPIVEYRYDLGNRVVDRTYRNGAIARYSYNANNWVTSLEHAIGVTGIASFGYDFDKEGNKKFEEKLHDPGHSEAYQYDNIYRLTNYKVGPLPDPMTVVTQTAYNLDPVGNWTSKTTDGVTQTRVHDEANELVRIDAANLTYDDNGNLLNDGAYTYSYDEENRLTSVTRNAGSAVVGQYQYDALGRRVQKIANPAGAQSTTQYFHDKGRIIEEQGAGGATQATYVYGTFIDEVLTMDRAGQTYYCHQNSLGSVAALSNAGASVSVVERYAYDAYGFVSVTNGAGVPVPPNAWGTPHSAIGNPYLFTGRQLDEETGLYYYRARYHDSRKGRFLQRDQMQYLQGMNLYEYVRSNPSTGRDPSGLLTVTGPAQVRTPGVGTATLEPGIANHYPSGAYIDNGKSKFEADEGDATIILLSKGVVRLKKGEIVFLPGGYTLQGGAGNPTPPIEPLPDMDSEPMSQPSEGPEPSEPDEGAQRPEPDEGVETPSRDDGSQMTEPQPQPEAAPGPDTSLVRLGVRSANKVLGFLNRKIEFRWPEEPLHYDDTTGFYKIHRLGGLTIFRNYGDASQAPSVSGDQAGTGSGGESFAASAPGVVGN